MLTFKLATRYLLHRFTKTDMNIFTGPKKIEDSPFYLKFKNIQFIAQLVVQIRWSEVDLEDVLAGVRSLAEATPWLHLTTLVISHNNLKHLPEHLSLTPHLHTLDATHNSISHTPGERLFHVKTSLKFHKVLIKIILAWITQLRLVFFY